MLTISLFPGKLASPAISPASYLTGSMTSRHTLSLISTLALVLGTLHAQDHLEVMLFETPMRISSVYKVGMSLVGYSGDSLLLESTDGGTTWASTPIQYEPVPVSITSIGDTMVFATTDNLWPHETFDIYVSVDHGRTLEFRSQVFTKNVNGGLSYQAGRLFLFASTERQLLVSDDNGHTFDTIPRQSGITLGQPHFFNDRRGLTFDLKGQLYGTDDGGHTWERLPDPPFSKPPDQSPPITRILDDQRCVLIQREPWVIRSDDQGRSWYVDTLSVPEEISNPIIQDLTETNGVEIAIVSHHLGQHTTMVRTGSNEAFTEILIERCDVSPLSALLQLAGDHVFVSNSQAHYRLATTDPPRLELTRLTVQYPINAVAAWDCEHIGAVNSSASLVYTSDGGANTCFSHSWCAENFRTIAWQSDSILFAAGAIHYATICERGCLVRLDVTQSTYEPWAVPSPSTWGWPPLQRLRFANERRAWMLSPYDTLYTSNWFGNAWTAINLREKLQQYRFKDMTVATDGSVWVVNETNSFMTTVSYTQDEGKTWATDTTFNLMEPRVLSETANDGVILGCMAHAGSATVFHRNAATNTWTSYAPFRDCEQLKAIAYNDKIRMVCLLVGDTLYVATPDLKVIRASTAPPVGEFVDVSSDRCGGFLLAMRSGGVARFTPEPDLVSSIPEHPDRDVSEDSCLVVATVWYDLSGRQVSKAHTGAAIKVQHCADGTMSSSLQMR